METEAKRLTQRERGNAVVDAALRASLNAEEATYQRQRVEFQEHVEQGKQKKRIEAELKETATHLAKARKG